MFDPQSRENCDSVLIPAFDPDPRSAADQNKQCSEARSRPTFAFTYPYRMWKDSYGISDPREKTCHVSYSCYNACLNLNIKVV
jgi:hypothetical protein